MGSKTGAIVVFLIISVFMISWSADEVISQGYGYNLGASEVQTSSPGGGSRWINPTIVPQKTNVVITPIVKELPEIPGGEGNIKFAAEDLAKEISPSEPEKAPNEITGAVVGKNTGTNSIIAILVTIFLVICVNIVAQIRK